MANATKGAQRKVHTEPVTVGAALSAEEIASLLAVTSKGGLKVYDPMVQAFYDGGEQAITVDGAGRAPRSIRLSLNKAIKSLDLEDKVSVIGTGNKIALYRLPQDESDAPEGDETETE